MVDAYFTSRLSGNGGVDPLTRPRVLLLGDAAVRPDGLERALVRGGFQVAEAEALPEAPARSQLPDALLLTAPAADERLEAALGACAVERWRGVPVLVLLQADDPQGPALALGWGAVDVLSAAAPLEELCLRLRLRLRGHDEMVALQQSTRVHELMFDIFEDVSVALRPEEIVQTLVRRVGQALGLAHCSFVLTPAGDEVGRVVAVGENPTLRDLRVDLARYPEIREALRTSQPVVVPDIHRHPLFAEVRNQWSAQQLTVDVRSVAALPVQLYGQTSGVFLLRTRRDDPILSPEQAAFAQRLIAAASKVLESEERRAAVARRQTSVPSKDPLTGCGSLDALDQRIRQEFARSRRYALSFSLILLDVDGLRDINTRLGNAGGDKVLSELGALLLRELRTPDFVSRYGGDEFALILPETDLAGARRSVTRVREQVQAQPFGELDPVDRPRLSAGIVTFPHPSAVQTEDLFALVEAALLRGKAQSEERIGTAESVVS